MDAKTLCLGVLSREPATGYDIRKAFQNGPFSHFCGAGFGSIYPALRKLSEDGLIEECPSSPDVRENKKIFSITPAGRKALCDELANPAPLGFEIMRSEFMFRVFFAHMMPQDRIQALFNERKALYHDKLDIIDNLLKKNSILPGEKFIAEMGKTLITAALQFLEKNTETLFALTSPEIGQQP
ncbi:MAG TPA: PadR family transcriptional regulator [Rhodospirillaceae bacterium]|nr:MAG: hypothetical protein A2018_03260 [Alphaproteobacteria bacterium GWF2_58_20]HAU29335.1 PadR family transcriptional regulator [Rhodospirillaceae bacterium]